MGKISLDFVLKRNHPKKYEVRNKFLYTDLDKLISCNYKN